VSGRLTDAEVVEQRNDAEMMRRPHLWPSHPYLPLKRRPPLEDDSQNLGLLADNSGPMLTVLIGNLFASKDTAPRIEYESADAVVADGWIVD
jgi:hypothetical protein